MNADQHSLFSRYTMHFWCIVSLLLASLTSVAYSQNTGMKQFQLLLRKGIPSPYDSSFPILKRTILIDSSLPPETEERIRALDRWVMSGTEDNEAYLRYLKEHDKTTLGDLELQDKRAAIAIEKLSTLVDRETWKNAVVQHNLVVLRIATRYPRDVKALPLSLRNRTFTELLDLSEDQLAKLEKIENDLREKWETWREERAQQINDLRNKKYREILAVLSKEQQKTSQEVYGDPIDFGWQR